MSAPTPNLRHEPYRFTSLDSARSFAEHCAKPMRVVLGDNGIAWVVCPSDAARLERAGYELAQ